MPGHSTPAWLRALLPASIADLDEPARLRLAAVIAEASVGAEGGPFGALVVNEAGDVVGVGWNQVVNTHDSTAHAEVVAIRAAQAALGTHDLARAAGAPYTLYTSCAPCIQCFGAIYWSGLVRVVAAAPKGFAEAVGFQEGPVSDALWDAAHADKGITYRLEPLPEDVARAPFDAYRAAGGPLY